MVVRTNNDRNICIIQYIMVSVVLFACKWFACDVVNKLHIRVQVQDLIGIHCFLV